MNENIDDDIQFVKGVGPKRADILKEHGISTVRDLLFFVPRRYLDRTKITPISELNPVSDVTVMATVESYGTKYGRGGRKFYIVNVTDNTSTLELIWYQNIKFIEGLFEEGDVLYISGKTSKLVYPQIAHPEFEFVSDREEPLHSMGLIPLYPTTAELKKIYLDSRGFRRIQRTALEKYINCIEEDLNAEIAEQNDLVPVAEALTNIHFPKTEEQLESSRKRLAFSELFYIELLLAMRRTKVELKTKLLAFNKPGDLVRRFGTNLPFKLTSSQRKVVTEIYTDMASKRPMRRLLQGDVGSGKTVVAALACALAIENGYKAAVMVPTEVLAEQHFINFRRMFAPVGTEILLLTAGAKEKSSIYERLTNDAPCLIIGTHALIQEKVNIHKFGLAIIDEQHRFGVRQRTDLLSGNGSVDLLLMTATPIPRTLAITIYGDFDYSVIDEFPPGRKLIETVLVDEGNERQVFEEILQQCKAGQQVYVVYPLVETSEKLDLQAAVDAYQKLKNGPIGKFGIGLLHGRMSTSEKEKVLGEFNSGRTKTLISTTVIEVGIDSPQATLMVVVGAERYGLSQLHQLRGRVGRGNKQSKCILKLTGNLTDEGRRRIEAMLATDDGFAIAEFDLQIRGPGEFFGTRQHGFPEFKFANITTDMHLLIQAREAAFSLIKNDPDLIHIENNHIRKHLLKHYSAALKFADAG